VSQTAENVAIQIVRDTSYGIDTLSISSSGLAMLIRRVLLTLAVIISLATSAKRTQKNDRFCGWVVYKSVSRF
jgi:hypothetical protein